MMIKTLLFASWVAVWPTEYGWKGDTDVLIWCEYGYGRGTVLTPDTMIKVQPYYSHHGKGSIIPTGSGPRCTICRRSDIKLGTLRCNK